MGPSEFVTTINSATRVRIPSKYTIYVLFHTSTDTIICHLFLIIINFEEKRKRPWLAKLKNTVVKKNKTKIKVTPSFNEKQI